MHDDYTSLYAFNRWANDKMLEACRQLTPEQYDAEPVPGVKSVRATVYHIAVVTEGWLRRSPTIRTRVAPPRRKSRRPMTLLGSWIVPTEFWIVCFRC